MGVNVLGAISVTLLTVLGRYFRMEQADPSYSRHCPCTAKKLAKIAYVDSSSH